VPSRDPEYDPGGHRRGEVVEKLSYDPEGVVQMPVALAAVGVKGVAKKVGGKLKKLFSRKRKKALKKVAAAVGSKAMEHSGDIIELAKRYLPGGSMPGGSPVGGEMGIAPMGPGGQVVHGHWTKPHGHVPSHWTPRRRPRMNPGNTRAMRRAIRRVTSGARLYSHLFSIAHAKRIRGTNVRVKRGKRGRFA